MGAEGLQKIQYEYSLLRKVVQVAGQACRARSIGPPQTLNPSIYSPLSSWVRAVWISAHEFIPLARTVMSHKLPWP